MAETSFKCPCCGAAMLENSKSFYCSNWNKETKCDFNVWKTMAQRELSNKEISGLFKYGKTLELSGFKSKKGNDFNATLVIADDETKQCGKSVVFKFKEKTSK